MLCFDDVFMLEVQFKAFHVFCFGWFSSHLIGLLFKLKVVLLAFSRLDAPASTELISYSLFLLVKSVLHWLLTWR